MFKRKKSNQMVFGMSELDLWHHAVLVFILLASFLAFLYVSDSKPLQLLIGGITAILYVGWGAIHHYYDNDLHFKNVIEYVLIAVLGMIILTGIIL